MHKLLLLVNSLSVALPNLPLFLKESGFKM